MKFKLHSVILAATVCLNPSVAIALTCNDVFSKFPNLKSTALVYNTNSGLQKVGDRGAVKQVVGNEVFLIRGRIDKLSAGGVVIVKVGKEKTRESRRDINLAKVDVKSRLSPKDVIKCKENRELLDRLSRLRTLSGEQVTLKQFLEYVRRPAASNIDDVIKKKLDAFQFKYRGSINVGNNTCDQETGKGGNLRQQSVVTGDTGGTTFIDNLGRAFSRLGSRADRYASKFDWTVHMLPYDIPPQLRNASNGHRRACIKIRTSDIKGADLIYVNDLEEFDSKSTRGDSDRRNRHRGDRSFSVE